jgi:hypothetical protein
MLLYHFNLGYPLLTESSYLIAPTEELKPRDLEAEKGKNSHNIFQKPTPDYIEQVFYHNLKTNENGDTFAALINEEIGLGIVIRFNKKQLFNLTQWKQMGEGEYVLGIEPCNCYVGGRTDSKKQGVLEYLEPGEARKFKLEMEILESLEAINGIKDEILKLCK